MTMIDQYHSKLAEVAVAGYRQGNRTDQWAITLPYGSTFTHDMQTGFPAVWSKELYFPGIKGEIIGFLRGLTNSADFAALGCRWWDGDANENTDWLASPHRKGPGDLGKIYGYQWRHWEMEDGIECIDQVQVALDTIRNDPYNRRIVISAWRPDHFAEMALPPCHVLYRFQVNVAAGELNMSVYQRSSDMFLGVPMNMAGAGIMLHLFAAATGLKPRWLTHHLDDTHIYSKAVDAVTEQLRNAQKPPFHLPQLVVIGGDKLRGASADQLAAVQPGQLQLHHYRSYKLESEKVPMATTRKEASSPDGEQDRRGLDLND